MTLAEFNTWLRRHQSLFPKLSDWLASQPDHGVVLEEWARALSSCDLQHANDATSRMVRGVGPLVEFNDWSTLPALIIQHCRPLGSGKAERSGDGNYVSGAALAAQKRLMAEPAVDGERELVGEFETVLRMIGPKDCDQVWQQIMGKFDENRLSPRSTYELLCGVVRIRDRGPEPESTDQLIDF